MKEFFRKCWTFAVPTVVLFVFANVLFFTGRTEAASMLSSFGMLGIIGLNLAYIVFFDSKKRWPGLSWFDRARRVFTFRR